MLTFNLKFDVDSLFYFFEKNEIIDAESIYIGTVFAAQF
jgi:hypothetical protein